MKRFVVISPVPEIIDSIVANSILRQAVEKELVDIRTVNLREFGVGNYRQIDDEPFGGGPGMVLMAEPVLQAYERACEVLDGQPARVIYPSPQGDPWTQTTVREEGRHNAFIFLCGHYKGIDERALDIIQPVEFSIGDVVVSGGEIPTMLMIDSLVRWIPGVLNDITSAATDTHAGELLDGPWYTRPRIVRGRPVPDVLLSGHHERIEAWRLQQRERRTRERRPDLWKRYLENKGNRTD
ncbi:MAG: tRNA (guanosine(37)-N1)-methyltransferase TrmD [Candidatus Neomarinimicrobiota bacterium]|nr:MAG: tRNA (guanosine(37)-N1)-methyltransferase TrmD [Candidatus Neomarinimicrobiota bacterium]